MSLLDVAKDAIKSGRLFREPNPSTSAQEHDGHVMEVLDQTGHKFVTWDPNNEASVEEARREFNRLKREGYTAYRMNVDHQDGVVVEEDGELMERFDPAAARIMMSPRLQGG